MAPATLLPPALTALVGATGLDRSGSSRPRWGGRRRRAFGTEQYRGRVAEPDTADAPDVAAADPPTPVPGWPIPPTTNGATTAATGQHHRIGRRRRLSRWDRPKPPHDWRFWVGGLGRVLIVCGLLLLGFVAYQLWGTGIETARAQRSLHNDFEELLASTPAAAAEPGVGASTAESDGQVFIPDVVDEPAGAGSATDADGSSSDGRSPEGSDATETADGDTADAVGPEAVDGGAGDADTGAPEAVPVDQQVIPLVEHGDALARLEIPRLGTDHIVVAGVETSDLKKGPGHFPETPLPGQLGNSAIAGHRTTYGQPFYDVDKLEPGDEMIVTTLTGTFVYVVTGQEIVQPTDYYVVATTDPTVATLTLTSCDPRWTAENRIVIRGVLDPERSAAVGEPVLNYGRPMDDEPAAVIADDDGPTGGSISGELGSDGVSGSLADAGDIDQALVGVDALSSGTANAGAADAFSDGWFSDPGAYPQVALWAAVLIAIWAGAYLLARHFRRTWLGIAAAIVPFVVALYFFYQNVNRMLPPNL